MARLDVLGEEEEMRQVIIATVVVLARGRLARWLVPGREYDMGMLSRVWGGVRGY